MGMAMLRFFKNQYRYPHYSNTITPYGQPMECTPVGLNLRSGTLRVKGDMDDFMNCNYMSLTRDGHTLYAWIDDVRFRTEDSFEVQYSVDAWRTYKNKIDLGTQFVVRQPQETTVIDPLLTSPKSYPEVTSLLHSIGDPQKRIFVVQVRAGGGEIFSNTPVNPTPYQFFMREYSVNNWAEDEALDRLMTVLSGSAETKNIVTMYSIPFMKLGDLPTLDLPVITPGNTELIPGFKMLTGDSPNLRLSISTEIYRDMDNIADLLRVEHSIQIVIPEAGIISVPDEIWIKPTLALRQDIDLFSGACNYMLESKDGTFFEYFTQSARGSSVSSIPIVSDPMDTYISQNQNALTTSLIGDVASIVGGAAVAGASGGWGMAIGTGMMGTGAGNIASKVADILDSSSKVHNPPAFLGTALVSNFNQLFWVITTRRGVTNASQVHSTFGYPANMVKKLDFPTKGYIQTQLCQVYTTDGSVPKWAIEEINKNFDNGILVH